MFRRGQEQLRPEGKVGPRVPELHQGALRYWWDIWLTLSVFRMVIDELLLICLKHICYSLAPMIPTKVFWCQIQNYTFSLSAQVHRPPIVYIGCQLIYWLPWDFWWDPRCKNYTVSLSAQVHRRLTPGWKVVVNLVVNLPPDLSWRQLLPIVAQGKVRGLFNFCWQRSRWPCWLLGCQGCVTLNLLTIKKIKGSTNLKPNDQKYLCATLNLVTLTVSNQVTMTMAIMTILPPVQDVWQSSNFFCDTFAVRFIL